jgi:hypothetical protein
MKRVLVVGGSTRAAAWSARRAGLQPVCADLFADLDTRQIAEVVHVRDYPCSLPQDVAHINADGWFYTGGIENHPDLVEQMDRPDASYGPLLGTSAAALRLIRDPFWLSAGGDPSTKCPSRNGHSAAGWNVDQEANLQRRWACRLRLGSAQSSIYRVRTVFFPIPNPRGHPFRGIPQRR